MLFAVYLAEHSAIYTTAWTGMATLQPSQQSTFISKSRLLSPRDVAIETYHTASTTWQVGHVSFTNKPKANYFGKSR